MILKNKIVLTVFGFIFLIPASYAQESILSDANGDGTITYLAFGDSITYGVGDGTIPGEEVTEIPKTDGTLGYPQRIKNLFSIAVRNRGVPGEVLYDNGISRFPKTVVGSDADVVGIMEGANDARYEVTPDEYERLLQKAINIARASGKTPLVFTVTPSCCDHVGLLGATRAYSDVARDLSQLNGVALADVEHAWDTTCSALDGCELFNLPEGLHPNTKGYDVIAQTAAAALLGINVFGPGGAAELESALGLGPGTVVVKPDVAE